MKKKPKRVIRSWTFSVPFNNNNNNREEVKGENSTMMSKDYMDPRGVLITNRHRPHFNHNECYTISGVASCNFSIIRWSNNDDIIIIMRGSAQLQKVRNLLSIFYIMIL